MARIVITRPNGETEYAELTTDKAQAGNDRLAVEKAGTTYYAKLDSGVSTHMFVIKPDGRKLYVQKEVKFTWKYEVDDSHPIDGFVIPRTGKYKITFSIVKHILRGHRKKYETYTEIVNLTQGDKPYDNKIGETKLYTEERDIFDDGSPMIVETKMRAIEYIGEA